MINIESYLSHYIFTRSTRVRYPQYQSPKLLYYSRISIFLSPFASIENKSTHLPRTPIRFDFPNNTLATGFASISSTVTQSTRYDVILGNANIIITIIKRRAAQCNSSSPRRVEETKDSIFNRRRCVCPRAWRGGLRL